MEGEKHKRILITGCDGFVGRHLVRQLRTMFGRSATLHLTSLTASDTAEFGHFEALDVTRAAAVKAMIARVRPTHVVHLAGLAAVAAALSSADLAWNVHLFGTLNVAHAILDEAPDCVLLSVGSGLVYGASASTHELLTEDSVLAPVNVYEVSKAAADLALGTLVHSGLKCLRLRPFNHSGAGQSEAFALPSFAMQIARIEAGLQRPVLRVGNLEAARDFLDVRDVTRAYGLAIERSHLLPAGLVLNIASGQAHRVRDLLETLLSMARVTIAVEHEPMRMRASDTPRIAGDASLAMRLLDWEVRFSVEQMLADLLEDCRSRVSTAVAS